MRSLLALLLLAGCAEPDFDQRYADTEKQIKAADVAIDKAAAAAAKSAPGSHDGSSPAK